MGLNKTICFVVRVLRFLAYYGPSRSDQFRSSDCWTRLVARLVQTCFIERVKYLWMDQGLKERVIGSIFSVVGAELSTWCNAGSCKYVELKEQAGIIELVMFLLTRGCSAVEALSSEIIIHCQLLWSGFCCFLKFFFKSWSYKACYLWRKESLKP